jgi:hypothetical protein
MSNQKKTKKNPKKFIVINDKPNPNDILNKDVEKYNCHNITNENSVECNNIILKKELIEYEDLKHNKENYKYLYPTLNDPNFNIKIAEKKEFNDTRYDGEIHDIKEYSDILSNSKPELYAHQLFVKNFLSLQTPYNSLLLFHGLGSGKTLTSIGACEEMRMYFKKMGLSKKILVVASPNVQNNFKTQLFDERKLKLVDGFWTVDDVIGNNLINEVIPLNIKNISKDVIISNIKQLINGSYLFLGYIEFANYIQRVESLGTNENKSMNRNLQNHFNNTMIVIDEVHNIRISDDNNNKSIKRVAEQLFKLVKIAKNIRLLLLSATPIYNSYKEIIWILNLMNINDGRASIQIKDIFDANGNLKVNSNGEEIGKELLIHKATGYISFVRGENPYTFPFRIYPTIFSPNNTFEKSSFKYPVYQMNGKKIEDENSFKILNLYLTKIGSYQSKVYKYVIDSLKKKIFTITTKKGKVREMPSFENMESFGYTLLQVPLESLNICYPIDNLDEMISNSYNSGGNSIELKQVTSQEKDLPGVEYVPVIEGGATSKSDEEEESSSSSSSSNSSSSSEEEEEEESSSDEEEEEEESSSDEEEEEESSSDEEEIDENIESIKKHQNKINPHELTGKRGLERIMEFVDNTTPPEKGSFKYREETINKYGKIFSRNEIGKYSSKIESICDNIVSKEGLVSEGIILIYSQFIDGGLVPVILALEEMGFTRYGDNVKSLFKTPPTQPVDAITFKTKQATKGNFVPAKYCLITGDPRISPNNDFEIKAATNIDNKDGNKIKVILISQSGSEGIDFKFIRQVHILQPWYNMSRIEQITGRAVRSFSHKDLPFEKRNVSIFLHGTILEDNKKEAADLYVYRAAEKKAVEIGKITRILKETSVDCILNNEQLNFTKENMAKFTDNKVTQILSNSIEINNFIVGDEPYSAVCDYMSDCEYKCVPDKKIKEQDINSYTYDENFLAINNDKIMNKIKQLFKQQFFYKKNELFSRINIPKNFPKVQIYSALSQIIDNKDIIIDKYRRSGYLVNIGEYYLFQPLELNNKNISLYDRIVPIDFKHSAIKFNIKENINDNNPKLLIEPSDVQIEIDLMKDIKEKYDLTKKYATTDEIIARADDNWYKHCGKTIKKMTEDNFNMDELFILLIEHIVDFLMFAEKVELLNYIFSLDVIIDNSIEYYIKKYFDEQIIHVKNITGIILYLRKNKVTITKVMILSKKKWVMSEPLDEQEIIEEATKKYSSNKTQELNNIVGFIGLDNKERYLVFKTKEVTFKRNTGARCDESAKTKKISLLNEIVGYTKYIDKIIISNEEMNILKRDKKLSEKEIEKKYISTEDKVLVSTKEIVQEGLCSLIELVLRYYNKTNKNNKMWFLNYEMSNLINF